MYGIAIAINDGEMRMGEEEKEQSTEKGEAAK